MKITKILAAEATPAKVILERAAHVALTTAERKHLPTTITVGDVVYEVEVEQDRALQVGEVLIDEAGQFLVIDPAVENVLKIHGDQELVAEAALALLNRGIPVAQADNAFMVLNDPAIAKVFTMIGLEYEVLDTVFDPIRPPKRHGGCGCGGHGHGQGEGCGCGGHGHHHHEHGEGCGCGGHGHHHEHGEGCGCGGHGHHHHEHGEGCGCGGHGHHHHEHGEGCGCGGHGHHHHDHEHGEECGCGCGGHHDHHHHHHH